MVIHLPSVVGFARLFILLIWLGFGVLFLFRKKSAGEATARQAPASRAGIGLQAVAFFVVWTLSAELFPSFALPERFQQIVCVFAVLLALASELLATEAVRVLGKQWSYQARLIEGHRLVVAGPYSYMRHPIYTGMLGMLVSTGLAFGVWWDILVAIPIFVAGTAIRVRAEERLLREAFGEDFEAYRRYVPAVIPRWRV